MLNPLNQTRQLYRKILQGHKPTEAQQNEVMQGTKDLKALLDHPGWKIVDRFMKTQQEGTHQHMERQVGSVNLITMLGFFNTFVKYIFMLYENRAYNKIRNFIKISIMKGEQYAEKRRKQAEADSKR